MKKRFVLVTASILVAALAASMLLGCKKTGEAVDYAGKYTLAKAEVSGATLEGAAIAATFPPERFYIEIIDSLNVTFVLDGEMIQTTYTKDGDVLHIKDGDDILDFTLRGNEISYYIPSENTYLFFIK
jgi:hypothetical protein